MRLFLVFIVLALPFSVASAQEKVLLKDMIELDSVKNIFVHRLTGNAADPPHLHGYGFVDTAEVKDTDLIRDIISELQYELNRTRSGYAMCFAPRHAVSIEVAEKRVDFLLCYQCKNVGVYIDGVMDDRVAISALSEGRFDMLFEMAGMKE